MSYNIFTSLKLERKELIHSSMIAAIASYNDGCRDLFFDMLAQKGDYKSIKALQTSIIEEKYNNWINTEHKLVERVGSQTRDRGRADIWIGNKGKPSYRLIIENKIDARNQNHQLRRYFRYLTGQGRFNAGLYYLCLKDDAERRLGAKNSAEKFKTESLDTKTDFHFITYDVDIKNWLQQVLQLNSIDAGFRQAVQQYLDIIIKIIQ